jgi:hypothetical protein
MLNYLIPSSNICQPILVTFITGITSLTTEPLKITKTKLLYNIIHTSQKTPNADRKAVLEEAINNTAAFQIIGRDL